MRIRPLRPDERDWVRGLGPELWGGDVVVGHGEVFHPAELDGLVAQDDEGERLGLLTFEVKDEVLEVVTLDAFRKREGIGTALMLSAIERAHAAACTRVRLITTNDDAAAIAFYRRLGFRVVAVHEGAVEASRALKPSIPLVGVGGTPITDEVELELGL